MNHLPCSCNTPNEACPRYGWMKGRLWDQCQGRGLSAEARQRFLDARTGQPVRPLSKVEKAINYTKALAKHVLNGKKLEGVALQARLDVCNACPHRTKENDCVVCGCPIDVKATWESEHCPLYKWPGDMVGQNSGGCGACH